jgi:hypothetical protein
VNQLKNKKKSGKVFVSFAVSISNDNGEAAKNAVVPVIRTEYKTLLDARTNTYEMLGGLFYKAEETFKKK